MAVVKLNKVNSVFSDIISDYLNNGYTINASTMGGTQTDEICHVDLINKSTQEFIRIFMMSYFKVLDPNSYYVADVIDICLRKYQLTLVYNNKPYWFSDGIKVGSDITFYKISNGVYVDSLNDMKEISVLRRYRRKQKSIDFSDSYVKPIELNKVPTSVKNSIMKRIKQIKGAKRANSWDCIKEVTLRKDDRGLVAIAKWEFHNNSGRIIFGNHR